VAIQEQMAVDQKAAMKARDKATLNAIRSVQSEVAAAKSAPGFRGEVDDDLYIATIATYVKRMTKSRADYEAMGEAGAAQAATLTFEIDYLSRYLPKKLDEDATRILVAATIAELGADASTPAGRVIGAVMQSGEDLDGALVHRLVTEALADS
jgi:uncharacterized protein YqeY